MPLCKSSWRGDSGAGGKELPGKVERTVMIMIRVWNFGKCFSDCCCEFGYFCRRNCCPPVCDG